MVEESRIENLKDRLDSLERENVDHLNFEAVLGRYKGVLVSLDTATQDIIDRVKEISILEKEIRDNPEMKGSIWTEDPWFTISEIQKEKIKGLLDVVSYKDWYISFMRAISSKMSNILDGMKGASEESIKAKSIKESYDDLRKGLLEIMREDRKALSEREDKRAKIEEERYTKILEVAGFKDGVTLKKKDEEISKLKEEMERLKKKGEKEEEEEVLEKSVEVLSEVEEKVKELLENNELNKSTLVGVLSSEMTITTGSANDIINSLMTKGKLKLKKKGSEKLYSWVER